MRQNKKIERVFDSVKNKGALQEKQNLRKDGEEGFIDKPCRNAYTMRERADAPPDEWIFMR